MILIHVMGGLGNQLNQYALYEKMKQLHKDVKLDLYDFEQAKGAEREWRKLELDRFPNISYIKADKKDRIKLLDNRTDLFSKVRRKLFGRKDKTYKESFEYEASLFGMDDANLYGCWNCDAYYRDIMPILRQKLVFPQNNNENNKNNEKNRAAIEKMKSENSVSIHVRRTDYLTVADGKRYMGICTDDYYRAAISYINERVSNPVFYIFSDDTDYCREHFAKADIKQENMNVIDWNTKDESIFDMQLMSACRHNICANSTFSMWGARLNDNPQKCMIRPLHHDNYDSSSREEIQKYWKDWILIDEKGKL